MARTIRDDNFVPGIIVTGSSTGAQVIVEGDESEKAMNVHITGIDTGSTSDGAILDGVSSSIKATVLDYSNSNPLAVRLTDTNGDFSSLALETGGNLAAVAASLAIIDDWDETDRAKVNPIVGQVGVQGGSGVVSALTQRVVLATDVGLPTGTNSIGRLTPSTTAIRSQVADSASDTLILASNTSRLSATIFNDSSALLYLGLGTVAVTSSDYSVRIYSQGYYEVPENFTGQIRGIWASDPNDGSARVTELT